MSKKDPLAGTMPVTLPIAVREWFVCASYGLQSDYLGKFLTIIDSITMDQEQRKAIKDLTKQMLNLNDRVIRLGDCLQSDLEQIFTPTGIAYLYDEKTPQLMELDYDYIEKEK